MYCTRCGSELLAGGTSCPQCGRAFADTEIRAKTPKSKAGGLAEALSRAGYRAKVLERDGNKVLAGRGARMDILLDVGEQPGLIIIHRFWMVKTSPPEKRSELLETVNKANLASRLYAFCLDSEGKNVRARSHIALAERLDGSELVRFMEALEADFPGSILTSDLIDVS